VSSTLLDYYYYYLLLMLNFMSMMLVCVELALLFFSNTQESCVSLN
jgi:hypothetical protein